MVAADPRTKIPAPIVAGLFGEPVKSRAAVDARRRAGLQPTTPQRQLAQAFGQTLAGASPARLPA